jgi:hypothetical protein
MKALKITLLLVAVLLLTVSGVQSDAVAQDEKPTFKKNDVNYNLIAHDKTKLKLKGQA